MFTLFLCVALCADEPAGVHAEVPEQVREYFERADKIRDDAVKANEARIKALEIAIRGEGVPQLKSKLRRELSQVTKSLDALKRSQPNAPMLEGPAIGDLGGFNTANVIEIPDNHTALVTVPLIRTGEESRLAMGVILTGPLVKSLKARQHIHSPDVWRVIETDLEKMDYKPKWSRETQDVYKVEPMKKAELEKYRAQYEAEKKQNAAPPAGIKDEKPKLDKAPMPDKPKGNASEK